MVTIRPYRNDDLPAMMDLGNRAWKGIYAHYDQCFGTELARLMRPDPGTSKGRMIQGQARAHPEWILVAEEDDQLIGFLVYELHPAHKIGQIEMWRLRREAEARLGSAFDLRTFHDAVLEDGALPLPVLRERVEAKLPGRGQARST